MRVAERAEFAERLRRQIASRYRGVSVEVDEARFALRVVAPGIHATLPLAPLEHDCRRQPEQSSSLIARFVAAVERQLTPTRRDGLSLRRVLWCVRARRDVASLARSDELLSHAVGTSMVAFVGESLPGSIMRGRARSEWEPLGYDDAEVSAAAAANTKRRFHTLAQRIREAPRVPADGWRLSSDVLFQGSAMLVPDVLKAFVERVGENVLLASPDRSLLLALPQSAADAGRFSQRVLREYREAMNPCSREILETDGAELQTVR